MVKLITLKIDETFLKDVDSIVKKENYANRTEFIREALRDKVKEEKIKRAMERTKHLLGSSKTKTTDEDFRKDRVRNLKNPIVKNWWDKTYASM